MCWFCVAIWKHLQGNDADFGELLCQCVHAQFDTFHSAALQSSTCISATGRPESVRMCISASLMSQSERHPFVVTGEDDDDDDDDEDDEEVSGEKGTPAAGESASPVESTLEGAKVGPSPSLSNFFCLVPPLFSSPLGNQFFSPSLITSL